MKLAPQDVAALAGALRAVRTLGELGVVGMEGDSRRDAVIEALVAPTKWLRVGGGISPTVAERLSAALGPGCVVEEAF